RGPVRRRPPDRQRRSRRGAADLERRDGGAGRSSDGPPELGRRGPGLPPRQPARADDLQGHDAAGLGRHDRPAGGPPCGPAWSGAAGFSPAGRATVAAGGDGTVEVWDWRAGRRLLPPRALPLATDWAFTGNRAVQISPDGRLVAIGGRPDLHLLSLA